MAFRVRAARPQDRAQWCELAGRGGPEMEAAWWDAHVNDPAWRLLVAENGRIVGKTAARLRPGSAVEVATPRVRKGEPVEPIAKALLESALLLREEGPYPQIEFKVSNKSADADELKRAAERLGFGVSTERLVVERALDTMQRIPVPFACRTLTEVGDEFLFPVFEKADRDRVARPAGYRASEEWAHVKSLPGFDPSWAFLATKAGDPIGYAVTNVPVPRAQPGAPVVGTISYLGILPEKRRHGNGTILHHFALHALRRRGATLYRDTVDVGDAAGRAILGKNGCREVGREWIYRRAIAAR